MSRAYSLYLHIPFCRHRCAYCDFNTSAGQEGAIPAYVDALCREIEYVGRSGCEMHEGNMAEAQTLFFGGGTPSLLSPGYFEKILRTIRSRFKLREVEISVEANPGKVSYESLFRMRSLGINRISFGAQSANSEELRMLERTHNFIDVIKAVAFARKAGFDNINLDLIYGLPGQSLQTWQGTVRRILDLNPEHLSAYALTVEPGTPFGNWYSKGLLPLSNPDDAAEMYEWAGEAFESAGYWQYEISNWARSESRSEGKLCPSYACRHNLQYWRGLPYLGFGAGGHGYANGYRYSNVIRIKTYIDRLKNAKARQINQKFPLSPAAVHHHKQSLQDDIREFMITGLRLTQEGISAEVFFQRFGLGLTEVFQKEIDELIGLGLLEWKKGMSKTSKVSDILRLTSRGRLLGNQAFLRFVE